MKMIQKGFTLIELLIVIAVLGVLAVAVLSAINPIEQIDRGKDTGSRSDAEQLSGAIDRYYTAQGIYPWQVDQSSLTAVTPLTMVRDSWLQNVSTAGGPAAGVVLQQLDGRAVTGTAGELKQSFTTRINDTVSYNTLYIYDQGQTGDSYYICFPPKSTSFKTEANKRCSPTGSATGDPTGRGLPLDLRPMAATICVTTDPYICLP